MDTTQRCDAVGTRQQLATLAESPTRTLRGRVRLTLLNWLSHLPRGLSARLRYLYRLRRLPSFRAPRTFNEWLNHLKLYDRTPLRSVFANRIDVRDYVAWRAPACRLVPVFGTFEALTPAIWDALPEAFVLKATHGSGMVRICRAKSAESFAAVHAETARWLSKDFGGLTDEWVYDTLPRRLVAEAFLDDGSGGVPLDYKFFCFGGRVELVQVDLDRFTRHVRNLYTRDFARIPGELAHPPGPDLTRPAAFDAAVAIAERLSRGIDFVRVDLYLIGNEVYFGEMTCFPGSGFEEFKPRQLDHDLGVLLSAVRVVRRWPRAVRPADSYVGAVGDLGAPSRAKAGSQALGSAVETEWA